MRFLLAIFLVTSLFTPPLYAADFQGTLQNINSTGQMNVGFRQDLPPMSYLNQEGVPSGYSIDMCKKVALQVEKKLNKTITVNYVPVTAEDRFTALNTNKIDILCGSTTNTLARREEVDFTHLTFTTGSSFLALAGSKLQNHFDGKKIGVVEGTTTAVALKDLLKDAETTATVVALDSLADGLTRLKSKKIDGLAADQVVLIGLILSSGDPKGFELLPDMFTFDPISLAVRRNDADFRLVADRAITGLFRSNEFGDFYKRWFGKFSRKVPSGLRALVKLNAIPEN